MPLLEPFSAELLPAVGTTAAPQKLEDVVAHSTTSIGLVVVYQGQRDALSLRQYSFCESLLAVMYAPPPRLNLVVLRSSNIDRAAEFYRQLGLLFTRHSHGTGPEHYTSEVDGLVFEIYPATTKSQLTLGTRIGFIVDSVDELVPLVTQLGAQLVSAPADSEWGRRAVVKDLDGHTIELLTHNRN